MLSKEQLTKIIYKQTEMPFFQHYLKEVQKNKNLRTELTPSSMIIDNGRRVPISLELTEDMKRVHVREASMYSSHEYGFFPYAILVKHEDPDFDPEGDLEKLSQEELDAIKKSSDDLVGPEEAKNGEARVAKLVDTPKPKKTTRTRKPRAKKATTTKTTTKKVATDEK